MRNTSIVAGSIMLALIVIVALWPVLQWWAGCSSPASDRACAAVTAPTNWIRLSIPSAPMAMGATG